MRGGERPWGGGRGAKTPDMQKPPGRAGRLAEGKSVYKKPPASAPAGRAGWFPRPGGQRGSGPAFGAAAFRGAIPLFQVAGEGEDDGEGGQGRGFAAQDARPKAHPFCAGRL